MKRAGVHASATVWRGEQRVGTLARTAEGGTFTYDAGVGDEGIAFRLPSSARTYETRGTNLHPFFAGLLPEGIRLRALEDRVKTSRDDLLSLLAASGDDCVGDISITIDDAPPIAVLPTLDGIPFEEMSFARLFEESLEGKRGREPTVPGVQEKISASMISFPVRSAKKRDFILKLNPAKMPRLIENEHFFLAMARACGLEVANAELVHDRAGAAGLLVERFDRSGKTKIHQEDACQLLDRYPADKYALSCADIAAGLAELSSAPTVAVAWFVRLVAFSYLVANGDLHAKNVSLRRIGTRVEPTPAYDLLSSLPYGDRKMALKLEGRDDNFKRRHLVTFGERFGVRPRATEGILDQLCDESSRWWPRIGEIGLDSKKTADLARTMKKRREDLG